MMIPGILLEILINLLILFSIFFANIRWYLVMMLINTKQIYIIYQWILFFIIIVLFTALLFDSFAVTPIPESFFIVAMIPLFLYIYLADQSIKNIDSGGKQPISGLIPTGLVLFMTGQMFMSGNKKKV